MNENCAFTIVAKNYIGLAKILEQSLKLNNENIDFKIFIADEIADGTINIPSNAIIVKNIAGYTDAQWSEMTFKYNLTEFCTAVKPSCFQYVFSLGYNKAIYFDPDIYIFSSIAEICDTLNKFDIALTPQISGIHIDYNGEHPEWAMNVNGIFNLGFCAMRKTPLSEKVISWWRKRLFDNAFADRSVGNFTDQKWMDWLPGFLGSEHLYVFHSLGMNMAPWNFFERELFKEGDNIMVRFRTNDMPQRKDRLMFIHFAGYDYVQMKQGVIKRKRLNNLKEYSDLILATSIYRDAIVKNQDVFDKFIDQKYSYGTYENGEIISSFHRRLYHGMLLEGVAYKNPYSVKAGSFYKALKKKKLISSFNIDKLNKNNISDINNKRHLIAILFKLIYKIIRYKRYSPFVKSLYDYCRPEYHTFLIK